MIDTHAHLNFEAFESDFDEVVERCFANGLEKIIVPGAMFDSSQKAVEISKKDNRIFSAVGLHPIHVDDEEFNIEKYRELAQDENVVAIGEIGLDYFHRDDEEFKTKQKQVFEQFVDLAKGLDLPIILHCRGSKSDPKKAYLEMLETLDNKDYYRGVIHCFTSTPEIAQKFLDRGFYIGFTGVVTFAENLTSTVEAVPLDKILIETDCPFMSPEPKRGERCEPWFVKHTAQKIAEIKNVELNEILEKTQENAISLFKLK